MEEGEREAKVRFLIEKATNSTAPDVDHRLLKAIKTVVRYSDLELRLASQTLMDLMKRDHSQVLQFHFEREVNSTSVIKYFILFIHSICKS